MAKIKKPKKKERADSKSQADAKVPVRPDDDSEGRMDFGGLPDRDLKKNLGGCG